MAVTPIVFAVVISGSPASATADDDISDDERTSAVDVEMVDYAYAVNPSLLDDRRVVHLRLTGTLPHDFTIAALDVAMFVPPGRDTYLRLPEPLTNDVVVCTIGDHIERGMRIDLARNVP